MMQVGVLIPLCKDIAHEFEKASSIGITNCQLCCWDKSLFTNAMAEKVKETSKQYQIEITALWCGWEGPHIWNFYDGPTTLGIVPPAYRMQRMQMLCAGSDFARKINVKDVITHAGFIPENPSEQIYSEVVQTIRFLAQYCKENGQYFLFETGQETPVTLRRLIQDVKMDNVGINLDPANLLLYGKGNPVDALDVFGEFVRGVHAKDGEYPTDGRNLGEEKALGQGRVHFDLLIEKLYNIGYRGALTIEREISGEEQTRDIIAGKKMLEELVLRFCH